MTIISLKVHAIIPLYHYSRLTLSLADLRPRAGQNDDELFYLHLGDSAFCFDFDFGFQINQRRQIGGTDDFQIALPFDKGSAAISDK